VLPAVAFSAAVLMPSPNCAAAGQTHSVRSLAIGLVVTQGAQSGLRFERWTMGTPRIARWLFNHQNSFAPDLRQPSSVANIFNHCNFHIFQMNSSKACVDQFSEKNKQ
jgi:hypothetical protein